MSSATGKRLDAFVLDAYGTLFDVHSLVALAETLVPGRGAELSRLWRAKQLEYSWLTSLMRSPAAPRPDFTRVTAHALAYAVDALALPLGGGEQQRLCAAYTSLSAFPDALPALTALAPRPRWILTNGTAAAMAPLLRHNGMERVLDGVISVDEADVFKPAPEVYALACTRLGLPADRIGFVSSNGWDAIGARAYGFATFWVNRTGSPVDRHGPPPHVVLKDLGELPAAAGG